jgi:hypothetical protein
VRSLGRSTVSFRAGSDEPRHDGTGHNSANVVGAGDVDRSSGAVPRTSAGEECDHLRDILRWGRIAQRRRGGVGTDQVRAKIGTDPSGCDGIGEHSVPGESACDAPGEAQQATLGGAISKMVRVIAAVRRSARDINDDAAIAAAEVLDCPPGQIGARLQVQGQIARPPGPPSFTIFEGRGDPRPGVVDQTSMWPAAATAASHRRSAAPG